MKDWIDLGTIPVNPLWLETSAQSPLLARVPEVYPIFYFILREALRVLRAASLTTVTPLGEPSAQRPLTHGLFSV